MAEKDRRQRGLGKATLAMLKVEDVMESSVYQMGKQQGEQEGELRGERLALVERLRTLGVDRLLDIPQELSADALAVWLGEPATSGG